MSWWKKLVVGAATGAVQETLGEKTKDLNYIAALEEEEVVKLRVRVKELESKLHTP